FEEFERIFKNKELPDEIEEVQIDSLEMGLMDLLVATGLAPSKKEAKRLIEQGGVLVDQNKVDDPFQKIELNNRRLLKVGKRKFLYVVAK
ncbi:MAG TPA: S4 domain-containing protein, partial [Candidatus Kapabacteria bacterium]|nr:S4 domain-containing protein [Candidatus Kapabacteria bacterium]